MAEKRRLNSISAGQENRNEGETAAGEEEEQDRRNDPSPKRIKLNNQQQQQQQQQQPAPNHPSTTTNYPLQTNHRTNHPHILKPKTNTNTSIPTTMPTNSTSTHHPRSQQNQRMADAALGRIIRSKPSTPRSSNLNLNRTNQEHEQLTLAITNQTMTTHDDTPDDTEARSSTIQDPIPSTSSPASKQLLDQIQNLKNQIETINKTVSNYKDVIETQTNLIDSIKSSLSCNICLEILDSPYALLCGHIFCHKDLYAWFHRANPSSTHDFQPSDEEQLEDEHGFMSMQTNESDAYSGDPNPSSSRQSSSDVNSTLRPGRVTTSTTGGQDQMGESSTGRPMNTEPEQAANRATTRASFIRPFSAHQKKQNLVCPQCRAEVTTRPMALYAIKEAADRLKSDETPSPSCGAAPTGSFRSQVELHRDEKDLTWGRLFDEESNEPSHRRRSHRHHHHHHQNQNRASFASHLPPIIVDVEDGVRRCGRCSWEIDTTGMCAGCGAFYSELADGDDSDDDSYHAPSVESEDLGTNYESEESEDEEEGEEGYDLWGLAAEGRTGMGMTSEWPAGSDDYHPFGLGHSSDHDDDDEQGEGDGSSSEIRVLPGRRPAYTYEVEEDENDDSEDDGISFLNRRNRHSAAGSSSTRPHRGRFIPSSSDDSHDHSMRFSDEAVHATTGLAFVNDQHSSSSSPPSAHRHHHQDDHEEEDEDDHMNEGYTSNQSEVGSFMSHHHRGGSSSDRLSTTPDSSSDLHLHHHHTSTESSDDDDEHRKSDRGGGGSSRSASIATRIDSDHDDDDNDDSLSSDPHDDDDHHPDWSDDESF